MRELKIYTGRAGVEMIDRAIKQDLEIRNMLDYLDHLQGTKVLTSEEKDSLKKMMLSSEKGNLILAVEILVNQYKYQINNFVFQ